ncbi:unnamed protein product, partial [Cryptosporidium hominis]
LFTLYKISLFKSFFTDAGRVPVTEEWRNTPDPKLIFERKDDGRLRFCKYELVYKPDRAHYCRQLNRNVLRMDHYCPWFGNCIGYFNYKFFFLALLYGCASLTYMMFSQINTLSNIWSDKNVTFGHLYLVSLGICFSAVLLIIVVPFFLFHAYITSRNETTIEFCEKRSKEKVSFYFILIISLLLCIIIRDLHMIKEYIKTSKVYLVKIRFYGLFQSVCHHQMGFSSQ